MRNKNISKLILFVGILTLVGLSCGVSDISNVFATKTPTPTTTYTPTPTFTPSSTPTSIPTSTPTATPLPDAMIEYLSDGTTRFTDFEGGYIFVLPDGWLAINFVVDDPEGALDEAIKENPDKAIYLNGFQNAITQKARIAAADFTPGHFTSASAPYLFNVLDDTTRSVPLSDILDINGQMLPQLLNAKVTTSDVLENSSGVPYGILDITISLKVESKTASIIEKLIIFKTDDYTVYITFAVLDELKEMGLQDVDAIIDSIELLP